MHRTLYLLAICKWLCFINYVYFIIRFIFQHVYARSLSLIHRMFSLALEYFHAKKQSEVHVYLSPFSSTSGRSFRQTVLIQILLLFHSPNEMKFMKKLGSCLFQDVIGRRHRLGIINNKQNSFAELWTKYTGNTQFHHVNSCWRQNSKIRAFHERNIHLFILEIQIFRLLSLCK